MGSTYDRLPVDPSGSDMGGVHRTGDEMTHDKLRELAQAATPGPWKADHNSIFRYVSHRDWSPVLHAQYEYDTGVTIEVSDANAEYIVAANPTTILRLLDNLAAKDAEIEAMREVLEGMIDLAEFWINREDRRGYSEERYKLWHSLGYGSNAMAAARAALSAKETKR